MSELPWNLRGWADNDVRAIGREPDLFDAADAEKWAGLMEQAADHIEPLEAALRTIQSAIPGYLKQKMTAEDFALIVIGAVDSKAVNQAFGRGADNQDAPLSPIEASVPPAKL